MLAGLLDACGPPARRPALGDPYAALVRAIVGQQLSTTAARAIHGRLLARFGGRSPSPAEILAEDPEELRAAVGLSRAKAGFLRSLAEHAAGGGLDGLSELADDELVAALTAVRGLGVWTAHMFMIFELGRPDVLAVGDLGVRRGAQRAYGLAELPSAAELEAIAEPWRPHRSAACLLLWHSLSAVPA